jgi:hypothetical protein
MVMPGWNGARDNRVAAGAALDRFGVPETDLLMSADPAGFEYFTGHGGVVTPTDSLDVVRQVAIDYNIRWLVLERANIVQSMVPVIELVSRPAWIGSPIFGIPYTGALTGDPAVDGAPVLVIFPVCTQAGDRRCSSPPTLARAAP